MGRRWGSFFGGHSLGKECPILAKCIISFRTGVFCVDLLADNNRVPRVLIKRLRSLGSALSLKSISLSLSLSLSCTRGLRFMSIDHPLTWVTTTRHIHTRTPHTAPYALTATRRQSPERRHAWCLPCLLGTAHTLAAPLRTPVLLLLPPLGIA